MAAVDMEGCSPGCSPSHPGYPMTAWSAAALGDPTQRGRDARARQLQFGHLEDEIVLRRSMPGPTSVQTPGTGFLARQIAENGLEISQTPAAGSEIRPSIARLALASSILPSSILPGCRNRFARRAPPRSRGTISTGGLSANKPSVSEMQIGLS